MSIASHVDAVPPQGSSPRGVGATLIYFFTRRRVAISNVLFVGLIVFDLVSGVRPRNVLDFRDPWILVGLSLVVVGLALRSWAVGILRKNHVLTTTGPYGLTRNPLYIGSFLMLFGFCALIGDTRNVWFMLVPLVFLYWLRIRVEEQDLERLFGADWAAYARTTPRVFPRHGARVWLADWRFAQWLKSREYRAPLTALVGLAAIQVWHFFPLHF